MPIAPLFGGPAHVHGGLHQRGLGVRTERAVGRGVWVSGPAGSVMTGEAPPSAMGWEGRVEAF